MKLDLNFKTRIIDPVDTACGIATTEQSTNIFLEVNGLETELTDKQIEDLRLEKVMLGAVYTRRHGG